MTRTTLSQYCDYDEEENSYSPKDDVILTYEGETVLEVDYSANLIITVQGKEHLGEYSFDPDSELDIKAYKEVENT